VTGGLPLGDALRVADVVRHWAARRPDAVALRHGERVLTYRELHARSSRLAQALLAAGAGPGTRVAHLDRTGPEVVELLFAASKVGAVLVPLNWRLAAPELEAIVADAGAPLLVAGPAFAETAAGIAAGSGPSLRVVGTGAEYEAWLAEHPRAARRATRSCRCTPRARPGSPRACSPRTATSPRRPRRRRAGRSTPAASR
jgi:long-chain acyl-CoA synthetase